jgi:hypothetical protein
MKTPRNQISVEWCEELRTGARLGVRRFHSAICILRPSDQRTQRRFDGSRIEPVSRDGSAFNALAAADVKEGTQLLKDAGLEPE